MLIIIIASLLIGFGTFINGVAGVVIAIIGGAIGVYAITH